MAFCPPSFEPRCGHGREGSGGTGVRRSQHRESGESLTQSTSPPLGGALRTRALALVPPSTVKAGGVPQKLGVRLRDGSTRHLSRGTTPSGPSSRLRVPAHNHQVVDASRHKLVANGVWFVVIQSRHKTRCQRWGRGGKNEEGLACSPAAILKVPPDDSPTIARRVLSPPKAQMFAFTHLMAAKQSWKRNKTQRTPCEARSCREFPGIAETFLSSSQY